MSQNAAAVLFHTIHVHSYRYSHGISILLGLYSCALSHRYPAREPKHAHVTWPTALPSLRFAKMADLHNDIIMQVGHCVRTRYKYSWGRSIQEMGGNVAIGLSIYMGLL